MVAALKLLRDMPTPYPRDAARDAREKRKMHTLPYGCITGEAQVALEMIQKAALSGRAKHFATHVAVRAFGTAGSQRRQGHQEPGLWCPFDLCDFTEALGWHKPDVRTVRDQLAALNVIRYLPSQETPGSGWIRFNPDYASWRALDETYRRARYRRPGAGAPKRSPLAQPQNQPIESGLIAHQQPGVSDLISENYSNHLREDGDTVIKPLMLACSEGPMAAARRDPLRMDSREEIKKLSSNELSSAAGAVAALESAELELAELESAEPADAVSDPWDIAAPPLASTATSTAASTADAPPLAPPAKVVRTKGGRTFTGEEQAYVRAVVDAYKAELKMRGKLVGEGQAREAAHWFYREARVDGDVDGDRDATDTPPASVPVEEVIGWYRATKRLPFWSGRLLPLQQVQAAFVEHQGSLDAYRAWVTDELAGKHRLAAVGAAGGGGKGRGKGRGPNGWGSADDWAALGD